ncbi:HIRAN domain-containing protein [Rudaea sp.]|uniref:HIRAN domain-containing protein n=1 Tax=Rudaea sp. TaxID=2136325 RepID=UPI003220A0DE
MRETGDGIRLENAAADAGLPAGLRARVWIPARYFFSRRDMQDRCWLWLHLGDGHVHALWLPATCLQRDDLLAPLLARLDAAADTPIELESGLGHAWPLPGAPVVPMTRWSVSWGNPLPKAIRAFADGLDTDVLDTLGQLEVPGPFFGCVDNYNALATLPPPIRRHRLQALALFPPLVAPLLLDVHERADMLGTDEDSTPRYASASPAVLDAIDRGRDLIGALAEHHRIDRALVRSPVCRHAWAAGHAPRHVLRLLHAMPAHARPRSVEELETWQPCLDALPFRPRSIRDSERLALAFAAGWRPTWLQVEQRFRPLRTALRDTRDFLAAALAEAAPPDRLAVLDVHSLGHAWLARRGLASLLDASRRWHAQPLVPPPPVATRIPQTVPALLGEMELPGGRLLELASFAALVHEGEAMKHCVADYWEDCVFMGTRIFHLATMDGETATAEFQFEYREQNPQFDLAQLRGPCNGDSTDAMARFAAQVLAMLNAPASAGARLQLVRDVEQSALCRHEDPPLPRLRRLDRRSREELAQVIAFASTQDDWHQRRDDVLRGAIAGFAYADGPRVIDRLAADDALTLVREPANPHDARAVRIDWNGCKLGYVPRAQNAEIACWLDAGHAFDARILDVAADRCAWQPVQFAIARARAADGAP